MRYPPLLDRLWAKVDKSPNLGSGDCWLWIGHVDTSGYGVISLNKQPLAVHRVVYEQFHGLLPERTGHHGVCVCHKCDVRRCVNPDHLFSGSHAVNMADAAAKKRFPVKRGEISHRAKLTNSAVHAIRRDRRLLREIAEEYGVSETTISGIRRRQLWVHLDEEVLK